MKFKANSRRKAIEYEKDLVRYWQEQRIFEKSVEQRPADKAYVFYDGPPFITGVPHHGTLLSSIVKDAVPRYWTMKGKRVERVWGWDCHGLPAEVYTEQKLGIHDKRDIGTKISLEEYITTCRSNMVQTGSQWEDTIARIGRWVNFAGAYKTMDKDYMESVWWAFKTLYDKGKIYEGEKVLLYCTRDATPISKAEVAMDNSYQDVTDPSVYVKFPLKSGKYLLAWTTTPWTLPANVALAVNPDLTYAEAELDGEVYIVAESLLQKVFTDEKHQSLPYKKVGSLPGSELVGQAYQPLGLAETSHNAKAYHVYAADYVSADEGTGIVHLAPAYGEEDFVLAQAAGIPVQHVIDDNGFYNSGEWQGQYVWEANKAIAKALHERGVVWKIDYIRHSYPHCHRCGTKLMYRAHPSWFMDIAGQRQQMLDENGGITWFPEHIKRGRFAKTVETAPDWNLSRDRFWATAMPVWKGSDGQVKVVGSYAELKELSGVELDDYHRPWVDDVTFTIGGVEYKRIDKVLDCWFESGSMPFAQFHYPFENKQKFEQSFPGDFIAEYVGQVRAWFYYLHAVNVGLFGDKAFKNVIVTGTIAGNDGRKMSKSYGNYTDPNELMDQYSADALRFLLLSSPLLSGEDYALMDKNVADVQRKLAMVWNMYDFFTMYAEVDGWQYDGEPSDIVSPLQAEGNNPLDEWIVSRLHQLLGHVDRHMQAYDIATALSEILPFVDDASNWYVRRSRRRFWKGEDDGDKQAAYATLHYVLVQLSRVLAPFTPFLAEELYRNLTGGESVHLLAWPEAGTVDELAVRAMDFAKEAVTRGLAQRAKAGLKVRQPVQSVTVHNAPGYQTRGLYVPIILDELNVKEVVWHDGEGELAVELDTRLTPELRREGLVREVIRLVQQARKAAGLQVDDRIRLVISSEQVELLTAVRAFQELIMAEVLATELANTGELEYSQSAKADGMEMTISLGRHA